MKHLISKLLVTTLVVVNINAGGKNTISPVTPIVPIIPKINPIPFYIGVGLIAANIERDPCPCKPDGEDIKDHRYGAVFRAGWDYNQYVGLEARALKTFGSSAFSETTHYGVYVKPQYHVVDSVNVYALLGYGKTEVDMDNGIMSCSKSKSGFAYGLGFEYDFSKENSQGEYTRVFDNQGDQEEGWGLWVDYQRLLHNEGSMHLDNDIVTAGITYDF
jgi:opacity protein-like surface antigen